MDWISIGIGAAAGAIAVLVCSGIAKLAKSPQGKVSPTFQVIVFVLVMAISRQFVEPIVQERQAESKLLQLSFFRSLKQHEPEVYAKAVEVIKRAVKDKLPVEQVIPEIRPAISAVAFKYLPKASDAALLKFADHITGTLRLLHSKDEKLCFAYINPQPGEGVDFTKHVGKEFAHKELDIVAEVMDSAAAAGAVTPPSEEEALPDMELVVTKLLEKHKPEHVERLGNLQDPNIDKGATCLVFADMYEEAKALPAPRNTKLIRYMVQQV